MTIQTTKRCPDCAETVLHDARVCKHCGYRFDGSAPPPRAPDAVPVDPALASLPHPRGPAPPLATPAVTADRPTANGTGTLRPPQIPVGAAAGNGMAIAALALGIVGIIFGLVPLTFFVALVLGVLAIIFGLVGRTRPTRRGMATTGAVTGIVAVGLGVAGATILNNLFDSIGNGSGGGSQPAGVAPSAPVPTAAPASPPVSAPPKVEPKARTRLNCDILLPDNPNGTYAFIAGGTIRNTGNVGVKVRVRARWQQLGADSIATTRTIRVPRGARREVHIQQPASQQQIDRFQSASSACSAKGTIIDVTGQPGA